MPCFDVPRAIDLELPTPSDFPRSGPDHDGIAGDRDNVAEEVAGSGVRGRNLRDALEASKDGGYTPASPRTHDDDRPKLAGLAGEMLAKCE